MPSYAMFLPVTLLAMTSVAFGAEGRAGRPPSPPPPYPPTDPPNPLSPPSPPPPPTTTPPASNTKPQCTLALNKWVVRRDVKNMKIEAAQNADSTFTGLGIFPSVSLARVTLAPCGVRTMHTHANVDELLYILSGSVSASVAWPNGTICEQGVLNPGDSYLYPRNLVHSARNPSCTTTATVLGFFTAFDSALVNIPPAAFNMPGGPFAPYAAPGKVSSITAASDASTLAYDPLCLARCGFGTTFGQDPVQATP